MKAYGTCICIRIKNDLGAIRTHQLLAKSRVTPLKTVSLPKLELCGAVFFTELMEAVKANLKFDATKTNFYAWTDSTLVLTWLQKPPSSWKTLVANRVAKATEHMVKACWRHVRSEQNPTDLISRGARQQDLHTDKQWWHGPQWLGSPTDEWLNPWFSSLTSRSSMTLWYKRQDRVGKGIP